MQVGGAGWAVVVETIGQLFVCMPIRRRDENRKKTSKQMCDGINRLNDKTVENKNKTQLRITQVQETQKIY